MKKKLTLKLGYDMENSRALHSFLIKRKATFSKTTNQLGGYIFLISFDTAQAVYEFGYEWKEEQALAKRRKK